MLTEILAFLGAILINALIGGIVLFLINLTGIIVIDITWISALIVGFLGIPGVIIVILLHFLL